MSVDYYYIRHTLLSSNAIKKSKLLIFKYAFVDKL